MFQIASRYRKHWFCSLKNIIAFFALSTWKNTFPQGDPYARGNKEKNLEINHICMFLNRNYVYDLSVPDK